MLPVMTPPVEPFTGPYAQGAPAPALRIVAPSLTRFGARELVRGAEIVAVLAVRLGMAVVRFVVRRPTVVWRWRRDRTARAELAAAASVVLVDGFMALGPTFVKLGQLIASSPGMFPAPLADACLRTLDNVPPFPAREALAVVEDDLGAAAGQVFRHFDPEPLSAASVPQVHACVLADGREAVLKIQRPEIRERMNRDLRMMYRLARMVDRTRTGHLMNAPGVVEDLHQVTNEELNFALEAHRQDAFREHITAFGDNRWVTAPVVYWECCGPRVICMERLHGTPMDRFAEIRARGIDGELVLRRGLKAGVEATLLHRPFPGDVHGGHIWLRDAQYTVMIDGDYRRIVRAWQRIGILSEDVGPVDEVAARLKAVLDPMFDMALGEVSLAFLLRQQLELQREYSARAARELVLVSKQLLYFERYAKELAPTYNMARDLFLLQNVFPEAVGRLGAERGITFPDDALPNAVTSATEPARGPTRAAAAGRARSPAPGPLG